MDLLEYQAKALFREMAIPVLPSQRIDDVKDLKGLKIPYPVVLKSQVRAGGRGKAGGIKFVENTIDAIAAAQTIFNLPIKDEYPEVLLAEAKYDADQELYLAVFLDPVVRRPVLLGSKQGGINVEAVMQEMQQVVVYEEFSPFYARRLAVKMGLEGPLLQAVSGIIEKMYRLFVQKDLDLVEINPLGISPTGEVMALDGKVSVNNGALGRHPGLMALVSNKLESTRLMLQREEGQGKITETQVNFLSPEIQDANLTTALPNSLHFVELEGNLGIICNGAGLTMTTLDVVTHAKGKPANFLNLGGEAHYEITSTLRHRLEKGLEFVTQNPNVKAVLVNILGRSEVGAEISTVIANFVEKKSRTSQPPKFVLRLIATESTSLEPRLSELSIQVIDNLDQAVTTAISLAKN